MKPYPEVACSARAAKLADRARLLEVVQERFVHNLVERPVHFEHGYNMLCSDCSGITGLTSAEYDRECNNAHVECVHCGTDIHFGPAVMTLRDADDPVLDDEQACSVAWYHTSTEPEWPQHGHPLPRSVVQDLAKTMPLDVVDDARRRDETQALHLGTYEAAIESMLRRVHDQDNGGAQFYLYRVALRRDGVSIEPGWRDETLLRLRRSPRLSSGTPMLSAISTSMSPLDRFRSQSGGGPSPVFRASRYPCLPSR
jgi:hypothetical protein